MTRCPSCGREVPSEGRFCPACGASLSSLSRAPAVAAALVVISLFGLDPLPGPAGMTASVVFALVTNGLLLAVLMRFGLLALAAAFVGLFLGPVAATTTWTAWYAQPAVLALGAIVLLAAYGVWAATAGFAPARAPVPEPATG